MALLSRLHVTSAIVRWDNTSFSRRHRARTFCLRHMILGHRRDEQQLDLHSSLNHFIVFVTNKHSSDLKCTPLKSLRADTADGLQFSWSWGLSKQLLLLSSGLYESRVLWQNQLGDYFRLDSNWVEAISQGNFLTTDLLYAGL